MRITLVSESFHPAVDDTTRTLKAVADRLIDLGHQVQLVAARQARSGLAAFAPDLVLVHPGRGPGCCNVLREAAASGVPVVAPADRSVLRNLETGLRLDRDSPGALARAVATVAADPQRRLLGECGRVAAAGRDWRVAVGELLEEHYPRARSRRAGVRADLSAA